MEMPLAIVLTPDQVEVPLTPPRLLPILAVIKGQDILSLMLLVEKNLVFLQHRLGCDFGAKGVEGSFLISPWHEDR